MDDSATTRTSVAMPTSATTSINATRASMRRTRSSSPSSHSQGIWSPREHDLFLEALRTFPNGPWKRVAAFVGSRSVRQVQTHAQKYNEKILRRLQRAGPTKDRKTTVRVEHRIDDAVLNICATHAEDNSSTASQHGTGASAVRSATGGRLGSIRSYHAAVAAARTAALSGGHGSDGDSDHSSESDRSANESDGDESAEPMRDCYEVASQQQHQQHQLPHAMLDGLAWDELRADGLGDLSIDDSLDYLISALLSDGGE